MWKWIVSQIYIKMKRIAKIILKNKVRKVIRQKDFYKATVIITVHY